MTWRGTELVERRRRQRRRNARISFTLSYHRLTEFKVQTSTDGNDKAVSEMLKKIKELATSELWVLFYLKWDKVAGIKCTESLTSELILPLYFLTGFSNQTS